MVDILFWIFFGALVGSVAAIIHGTDTTKQSIIYIAIGVVGGLSGGLAGLLLSSDGVEYIAQASGLSFAVFGAIVFVVLARYAYGQRSEH